MKLLDTNVFIYAVGRAHALKTPCAALLASVAKSPLDYALDVEVLQELLYVYSSRGERARGFQVVAAVQVLFPAALPITGDDVRVAVDLMKRHPHLIPRDALHAAIVLNYGLEGIISTDGDFDRLPEISRFAP